MPVRSNRRPLIWVGLLVFALALIAPQGAGACPRRFRSAGDGVLLPLV